MTNFLVRELHYDTKYRKKRRRGRKTSSRNATRFPFFPSTLEKHFKRRKHGKGFQEASSLLDPRGYRFRDVIPLLLVGK